MRPREYETNPKRVSGEGTVPEELDISLVVPAPIGYLGGIDNSSYRVFQGHLGSRLSKVPRISGYLG